MVAAVLCATLHIIGLCFHAMLASNRVSGSGRGWEDGTGAMATYRVWVVDGGDGIGAGGMWITVANRDGYANSDIRPCSSRDYSDYNYSGHRGASASCDQHAIGPGDLPAQSIDAGHADFTGRDGACRPAR